MSANSGFDRLEGHGGPVKGIAVSPDGTAALTASFDYAVGVWGLPAGGHRKWLDGHEAAVNAVAYLPDGRAISAGDDFRLILWDPGSGRAIRNFEGHRGKVAALAVAPDAAIVASGGWDGWIGLWELTSSAPPRWLKGHAGPVNAVAFSRDGRRLYSASYDGTVRRWNVATGELEATLVRHGFGVNHLVLNEAEGWLAYGAVDGGVRAIDLDAGAELADLTADRRPILALAQSPDGNLLAVGDGEGYVTVIETDDWEIARDFHAAAEGPIWALAWTADGERLISGGLDNAAVIWPIAASAEEVEGVLAREEPGFLRDPDEMTNGERQFARKCSVCHTLTPGSARRAGPSLWGLFGRLAGSVDGYRYSEALSDSGIVWTAETIDRLFREGPEHYTPGSKMPMQRINGAADRRDLIEFLAASTGPAAAEDGGKR